MVAYDLHQKAAAIVRDAGGQLVGRTRLQKVTYLSQLSGFAADFPFEYRHYGPFSEELADAMEITAGTHLVNEEEKRTDWGGWYSIYKVELNVPLPLPHDARRERFISAAAHIGAIELELAATAAFLYTERGIGRDDNGDPWAETEALKPEKASNGRLEKAKREYKKLLAVPTPKSLPPIA